MTQPGGWHVNIPPETRSRNPLFLVLAVLSGMPTAFFVYAYIAGNGQSAFIGLLFLWSAMWTLVWWKMSDRYR